MLLYVYNVNTKNVLFLLLSPTTKNNLISVNLPLITNFVITETILIGNPALNHLKPWISDNSIRG